MTRKNKILNLTTDFEWIDLFDSYVEERENHIRYMKSKDMNMPSKNNSTKNIVKESDEIVLKG